MKLSDINIRDPFILADDGKYYMYGSRGVETWGKCTGLDVYVSSDLEIWSEPTVAFAPPEDFWSDMNFWASEPTVLFRASEPSWSDGYLPGKYVTDGPFMYRTKNGRLIMIFI